MASLTGFIESINFRTIFSESYLRNNRSTGQKSLRCFPGCKETRGHINGGFCGQSLKATIIFSQSSNDIDFGNILVLAQIHPTSVPGLSASSSYTKNSILSQVRVSTTQGGDLIIGNIDSVTERIPRGCICDVTFNPHLHSWDYGWKSNRWSGVQETHVVEVSVLSSKNDLFNFIGGGMSSTFLIVSNKKSRKKTAFSSDEDSIPNEEEDLEMEEPGAKRARSKNKPFTMITMAPEDNNPECKRRPSAVSAYDTDVEDAILALASFRGTVMRNAPLARPSNFDFDVQKFNDARPVRKYVGGVDIAGGLFSNGDEMCVCCVPSATAFITRGDSFIIMPVKNS